MRLDDRLLFHLHTDNIPAASFLKPDVILLEPVIVGHTHEAGCQHDIHVLLMIPVWAVWKGKGLHLLAPLLFQIKMEVRQISTHSEENELDLIVPLKDIPMSVLWAGPGWSP